MRKITLLLLIFSISSFLHLQDIYAQQETASLNEPSPKSGRVTGIIFSVDPKTNGVNGIFIKEPDAEAQLYALKSDCYRCEFYQGSIEGPYTITKSDLKPGKNAVLTINTAQNLMPGKVYQPGPFPPGSRFNLARLKTTVINNQNGSFKLRVN